MRPLPVILLALAAGCVASIDIGFRAEEITAEATEPVPLYDANTVAGPWGKKLLTVETLRSGQRVRVTECQDRKSDIDLLAVRAGLIVVIGGNSRSLRLHRRDVSLWSQGATTSCRGFFESISVVSMARQPPRAPSDA